MTRQTSVVNAGLVACPLQIMDAALIEPLVDLDDKLFAQRVLADVSQLFLVFDSVADAMMEGFTLPGPWLVHMTATEPAFPEFDPLVNAEMKIMWRTKEVNVVGHKQVVADQPSCGFCTP